MSIEEDVMKILNEELKKTLLISNKEQTASSKDMSINVEQIKQIAEMYTREKITFVPSLLCGNNTLYIVDHEEHRKNPLVSLLDNRRGKSIYYYPSIDMKNYLTSAFPDAIFEDTGLSDEIKPNYMEFL